MVAAAAEDNLESEDKFYPVCIQCVQWNPFLIFLDGHQQSIKYRDFPNEMHLFCPKCSPEQEHFETVFPGERLFREESILNDQVLLDLLGEFNYDNPLDPWFAQIDRIIITEDTKLLQPYKNLAKRSLPRSRKLALLMDLFPAVHRLVFQKFRSFNAMRKAVHRKVSEITEGYLNLEFSELHDHYDTIIDRTPMHARVVSNSQQRQRVQPMAPPPPPPPPNPEEPANRTVSSVGDLSMISVGSLANDGVLRADPALSDCEINLSSQERPVTSVLSSQSLTEGPPSIFSSQDVSTGNGHIVISTQEESLRSISIEPIVDSDLSVSIGQPSPPRTRRSTSINRKRSIEVTESEDDSSAPSTPQSPDATLPAASANQSQEAGPSSKRQRTDLPTNPSPVDFQRNPGKRLPRLVGA